MKTILIPTDFNSSSLDFVPQLLSGAPNEELQLVFVHLFRLSDSITDLLMLSRRSREYEYVSEAFLLRCRELQRQHPAISAFRIEFFYGSTLSMFRNFLEAQAISAILHPSLCSWNKLNAASIDPSGLITKCGLPVMTLLPKQETRKDRTLPVRDEARLMAV